MWEGDKRQEVRCVCNKKLKKEWEEEKKKDDKREILEKMRKKQDRGIGGRKGKGVGTQLHRKKFLNVGGIEHIFG